MMLNDRLRLVVDTVGEDGSVTLTGSKLRAWIEEHEQGAADGDPVPGCEPFRQGSPEARRPLVELTWKERLWLVPAETRLGVKEAAEALGKSKAYIYDRTSPKRLERNNRTALPHRKLEGEMVFTAGELRTWIRTTEDVVAAEEMDSIPDEREVLE